MKLQIQGAKEGVELSDATFGREFSEALVHQVVTAYMAGARAGTKATKSRSDVRGGGRKPWKQKGTGRARAGTIRSPIWRGGGHTFAARPRDFSQKVNRKMFRGAMQCILSELVRQERLIALEALELAEPKTKLLSAELEQYGGGRKLIVTAETNENLYLAARNIPNVNTVDVGALDPVSLVGAEKVLVTVDALKQIEEWLG